MEIIIEIFKPIIYKGKETNYLISNYCTIKNKKTKKERKPYIGKNKYQQINLSINGKQHTFNVHKLIADAFIENPNNYPIINHKNGELNDNGRLNNCVNNLEHTTYSHNIQHAYDTGLRNDKGKLSNLNVYSEELINKIINRLLLGQSNKSIAKELEIKQSLVSNIRNKKSWKHLTKNIIFSKRLFNDSEKYSSELKNDILILIKQNKRTKDIIKELNLSNIDKIRSVISIIRKRYKNNKLT